MQDPGGQDRGGQDRGGQDRGGQDRGGQDDVTGAERITAHKRLWRERLRATRTARSSSELVTARGAVRTCVLERCATEGWTCIAAYVPLRTEPGSVELLADLRSSGVRVLVPITLPDRDLDWAEWHAGAVGDAIGPDAIGAADAVLVPASAVARDGTRLGRGGGSYDRALLRAAPRALRVAVLFDGELVDELPRDEWDQPVTDVVQPSGWTTL